MAHHLPVSDRFGGPGATADCGRLPPKSFALSCRVHERRLSGPQSDRCRPTPGTRLSRSQTFVQRGWLGQNAGTMPSPAGYSRIEWKSPDHFLCAQQQRLKDGEAESHRRREVGHQFELRGLLVGNVAVLGAAQL